MENIRTRKSIEVETKPLIRIRKSLLKNKLYGAIILLLGLLSALVDGSDCTCMVFCALIAVSLFVARKNWIN